MIYADNASTTKISDNAFERMRPFLQEQYGNPSSQYKFGVMAKRAIEQARSQIAQAINAKPIEVSFTSSGSEANNWLLRCIVENLDSARFHIITSSIEHPSILNACGYLSTKGVNVTYLPVDATGRISVDDVKFAIRPNTKLVSLMLANNEIGTIQPIAEVGQLLHEQNILFHTDAVQAVGHVPVDVNKLQVDFLTASAHKFNGAKGTGILYKRSGVALTPLVFGGEQEQGLRAGTENVAGIVAAGHAIEESISQMSIMEKRLNTMVDATVKAVQSKINNLRINGGADHRLPGIVNIGFGNISGEALMHLLGLKGICVSTSSACSSGMDEPSHVLLALGLSEQQAKSSIRISYGRYNTEKEAEELAVAVCNAYRKITNF